MVAARGVHARPASGTDAPPRGGTQCAMCRRPDVAELEAAIEGGVSMRKIASQLGIDHKSVSRHMANQTHRRWTGLSAPNGAAGAGLVDGGPRSRLARLAALAELAISEAERALRDGRGAVSLQSALALWQRAHQNVELELKVSGELDTRPQVNLTIMAAPEWPALASLLFEVAEREPEVAVPLLEARLAEWEAGGAG